MHNSLSMSRHRRCTINEDRANQLLSRLDKITNDIRLEKKSTSMASQSLTQLSKQIQSLSYYNEEKFTSGFPYMSGKVQLYKKSRKFEEQNEIVDLLNIIENKDPSSKNFLTPELMQSKLTKKIFQTRKRGFGSNEQIFMKQELEKARQYEGLGSKESLMLKKIMINGYFSPQMKDLSNIPEYKARFNSNQNETDLLKIQKSPVFSNSSNKKVRFRKNFDDININKDYGEIVKKKEIENGLNKARLTKLTSMKTVFKMEI